MEKLLKNRHAIMSLLLMIAMLLVFMPYGQSNIYAASKVHFEYGNIKIVCIPFTDLKARNKGKTYKK